MLKSIVSKVKNTLFNKKGNAGLVYVLFILITMTVNFALGVMENNIAFLTVTEIRHILEDAAPLAARSGISDAALMNESLVKNYNTTKAKDEFSNLVMKSLSSGSFSSRIRTPMSTISTSLKNNTKVKVSSGKWMNTWDDSTKSNDFIIITTVLPIELEHKMKSGSAQNIVGAINETTINGTRTPFKVSFTASGDGLGAFITFEARVLLA